MIYPVDSAIQRLNNWGQISSLVGYLNKTNAFLVYVIGFNETVHEKWCLEKSVRQSENGLERGFVKH